MIKKIVRYGDNAGRVHVGGGGSAAGGITGVLKTVYDNSRSIGRKGKVRFVNSIDDLMKIWDEISSDSGLSIVKDCQGQMLTLEDGSTVLLRGKARSTPGVPTIAIIRRRPDGGKTCYKVHVL
jgi:hypothetical protein